MKKPDMAVVYLGIVLLFAFLFIDFSRAQDSLEEEYPESIPEETIEEIVEESVEDSSEGQLKEKTTHQGKGKKRGEKKEKKSQKAELGIIKEDLTGMSDAEIKNYFENCVNMQELFVYVASSPLIDESDREFVQDYRQVYLADAGSFEAAMKFNTLMVYYLRQHYPLGFTVNPEKEPE